MPAADREWSLERDLDDVLEGTEGIWDNLRGARIFITGGTGFIGSWLLEALRHADLRLGLGLRAVVLTRRPAAFARKAPHLAGYSGFTFVVGDVIDFPFPDGAFSHLIHAATEASADLNQNNPRRMFDTVVAGTRQALDFAVEKEVVRTLYLSSGAVYGQQPWEMVRVSENWLGAPDPTDPRNAYAEGKRAAEMLCAIYAKQSGTQISIARIFALLGPHFPLEIHFAAGNFIRDALAGRPVVIHGNGTPCRSYLYASDLTVWLLHMLVRAEAGKAYNVGSDESVSIRDLAERIARLLGDGRVEIRGAPDIGWNPGRYVPDTSLACRELGLYKSVPLDEAIRRTAFFHGWVG